MGTEVHRMNAVVEFEHEPLDIQWFGSQEAVFACLSRMIKDGWVPCNTHTGVVHDDLVARPVKIHGNEQFSGVALYKIK